MAIDRPVGRGPVGPALTTADLTAAGQVAVGLAEEERVVDPQPIAAKLVARQVDVALVAVLVHFSDKFPPIKKDGRE